MGKDDRGVNASQSSATGLSNEQRQFMNDQNTISQQSYQKAMGLLQPSMDRYSALASGDRNAVMQAVAPQVGAIDSGYQGAKDNIFETIAPGAARDFALAGLQRGRATSKAGYINEATTSAYDKLAGLAQGFETDSLNRLGATARFGEGASQSNQVAGQLGVQQQQTDAQRKQAQMGFLGDLATTAGSMGTAGITKSDRRLKRNIRPFRGSLDRLLHVEPVVFDYNAGPANQIGVIAQDLLKAGLDELVSQGPNGFLRVDYGALAAVCLGAIRELHAEVVRLRAAEKAAA